MESTCTYLICAFLWIAIIGGWIVPMVRKRIIHEIFVACGLGIMFSLVIMGQRWESGDISLLAYTGYALYLPAILLVGSSFITLHHKGEPRSGWEHTTILIGKGVFGIVRHPLYLGSAFFAAGVIFIIQSPLPTILGSIAIFCFWMASKREDWYNIEKFGDHYKEYMERVPMWKFLKGLQRDGNQSDEKKIFENTREGESKEKIK